jgi:hypothetical protein
MVEGRVGGDTFLGSVMAAGERARQREVARLDEAAQKAAAEPDHFGNPMIRTIESAIMRGDHPVIQTWDDAALAVSPIPVVGTAADIANQARRWQDANDAGHRWGPLEYGLAAFSLIPALSAGRQIAGRVAQRAETRVADEMTDRAAAYARRRVPTQTEVDGTKVNTLFLAGHKGADGKTVALATDEVDTLARILGDTKVGPADTTAFGFVRAKSQSPRGGRMEYYIDDNLMPRLKASTLRHETGHMVDFRAGLADNLRQMPQVQRQAIVDELEKTSATLARRQSWRKGQADPDYLNYLKADRELLADAVKSYQQYPDLFKAAAPTAARWIRDTINKDPVVSRYLGFAQVDDPQENMVA